MVHHAFKTSHHRNQQFNPHRFWTYFLSCFILVLAAELLYFSWFFTQTVQELDAQAVPTLETNGATIKAIEDRLDTIESTIQKRTSTVSNQN